MTSCTKDHDRHKTCQPHNYMYPMSGTAPGQQLISLSLNEEQYEMAMALETELTLMT